MHWVAKTICNAAREFFTLTRPDHCRWRCDDDIHMPDTWDGSCGAKWTFIDGGPTENDMRYCPQCGCRVLVEKKNDGESEDE